MALIKLGGGVTDIRGSIGGTTYSRSKAGNYARSNKKPVNPRSSTQTARRAQAAYLSKYWSNTLTAQQRADWRAYAAGTTWTNKLGETIEIGGNAAFMQLNMLEMIWSTSVIAPAPLAMGHAGGVAFTFLAENDTSKIQVAEPTGSFDKDTANHCLLLFQGLPSEAGRDATPKGFRYIGRIFGSLATPMTFPYELDSAYTMQAGQLITIKGMFHDENYRTSGPHWATATAAPSI